MIPRRISANAPLRAVGLALAAAVLFCAGCEVGPNFHPPHTDMPGGFGELKNPTATGPGAGTSATNGGPPVAAWWNTLGDPELDRLIAQAAAGNFDVQIAGDRILEARAQRGIVSADLFPEIDANGGYEHARGSSNVVLPLGGSGDGSSGGGAGGGAAGAGGAGASADPPASPTGGLQHVQPLRQSAETPAQSGSSSGGGAGATSAGGSGGAGDRGSNPFANPLTPFGSGGLPGKSTDLFQAGFDATWELDVFGGNRRQVEAANADLAAAVEDRRDLLVTLLAEVARDYTELRGTQARLAIAQGNLADAREVLDLTQSMHNSGLATDLDVSRAAGELAQTAAALPPLQTQVRMSIHALGTLLGRDPESLASELQTPGPVPPIPPQIPVGLPSDLLLRRPDIRRANWQIAAATARVGAATADLFPKFGLTGSAGLDATEFTKLFNGNSRYFLINPAITWPAFDAGRIVSNISLQKATADEALLQYKKTVLGALQDVEDSLVSYAQEQARHAALAEAEKQSADALSLARSRYQNGLSTFLDVLDAQRTLFSAQDALAISNQAQTTDLIALYKALGGGWQVAPAPPGNAPAPVPLQPATGP